MQTEDIQESRSVPITTPKEVTRARLSGGDEEGQNDRKRSRARFPWRKRVEKKDTTRHIGIASAVAGTLAVRGKESLQGDEQDSNVNTEQKSGSGETLATAIAVQQGAKRSRLYIGVEADQNDRKRSGIRPPWRNRVDKKHSKRDFLAASDTSGVSLMRAGLKSDEVEKSSKGENTERSGPTSLEDEDGAYNEESHLRNGEATTDRDKNASSDLWNEIVESGSIVKEELSLLMGTGDNEEEEGRSHWRTTVLTVIVMKMRMLSIEQLKDTKKPHTLGQEGAETGHGGPMRSFRLPWSKKKATGSNLATAGLTAAAVVGYTQLVRRGEESKDSRAKDVRAKDAVLRLDAETRNSENVQRSIQGKGESSKSDGRLRKRNNFSPKDGGSEIEHQNKDALDDFWSDIVESGSIVAEEFGLLIGETEEESDDEEEEHNVDEHDFKDGREKSEEAEQHVPPRTNQCQRVCSDVFTVSSETKAEHEVEARTQQDEKRSSFRLPWKNRTSTQEQPKENMLGVVHPTHRLKENAMAETSVKKKSNKFKVTRSLVAASLIGGTRRRGFKSKATETKGNVQDMGETCTVSDIEITPTETGECEVTLRVPGRRPLGSSILLDGQVRRWTKLEGRTSHPAFCNSNGAPQEDAMMVTSSAENRLSVSSQGTEPKKRTKKFSKNSIKGGATLLAMSVVGSAKGLSKRLKRKGHGSECASQKPKNREVSIEGTEIITPEDGSCEVSIKPSDNDDDEKLILAKPLHRRERRWQRRKGKSKPNKICEQHIVEQEGNSDPVGESLWKRTRFAPMGAHALDATPELDSSDASSTEESDDLSNYDLQDFGSDSFDESDFSEEYGSDSDCNDELSEDSSVWAEMVRNGSFSVLAEEVGALLGGSEDEEEVDEELLAPETPKTRNCVARLPIIAPKATVGR